MKDEESMRDVFYLNPSLIYFKAGVPGTLAIL